MAAAEDALKNAIDPREFDAPEFQRNAIVC